MDELKAGQGLMTDKHAAELAASQDAARKAQEQAEALRQAERRPGRRGGAYDAPGTAGAGGDTVGVTNRSRPGRRKTASGAS
jgi:hypothetical protein